jgi:hypothetical protein
MYVRLIKPWLFNPVGRVLLVEPGVADVLFQTKRAEPHTEVAAPLKRRRRKDA